MDHLVLVEFFFQLSELSSLVVFILSLLMGVAGLLISKARSFALNSSDHHHYFVFALLLVSLHSNVVVNAKVVALLLLKHFQ